MTDGNAGGFQEPRTPRTRPRVIEPDIDSGDVGDITDVQSYSYLLAEWMFDTLVADPFFSNFVVRRTAAALPVEAWSQVPFLGVYLLNEPQSPDGAYNVGEIRLSHHVTVGFQIILRNNDPDILRRDLDRVYWYIHRLLLRLDDLTNRFGSAAPGQPGFNGIERALRRPQRWGLTGSKNETPVGEQQFEWTLQFVTSWYPYGFDDLDRITVRTGFPIGSTRDEQLQVQQVTMVYEFNPDWVPNPLPPGTEKPPDPFPLPP